MQLLHLIIDLKIKNHNLKIMDMLYHTEATFLGILGIIVPDQYDHCYY